MLCTEFVSEISLVQKLKDDPATKIAEVLKNYKSTGDDRNEKEYCNLHLELKVKN